MYVALMAGYSQVALWTYHRRAQALNVLDTLCSEGLRVKDLVGPRVTNSEDKSEQNTTSASSTLQGEPNTNSGGGLMRLDLSDSSTIVSLLLLRRCLRKVGARYNRRMDGFSLAFFATGVIFVGALCMFYLAASPVARGGSDGSSSTKISAFDHRAATDALLVVLSLYVSVVLAALVLQAADCNEAYRFRSALQRACLTSCASLVDLAGSSAEAGQTWREALAHKELLQTADTQVGYEEEVVDPVTVLGRPASVVTVYATISAIFTGLAIAFQGWLSQTSAGWSYSDLDGVWRPPG
ncbi:unnamed protein product [Amoebophrya sp. A25]|nr:unnamed protein product [Amoebophrya sp. A25]|eukprot:GSA25T00024879001.1